MNAAPNQTTRFVRTFPPMKRTIRGSDRQSRTEAFLRYAEEHPDELVAAMTELSDREIRKLVAEEKRLAKAMRSPRRYKPTADELAAVPF
jgi:predicted CopG family antitoxin